MAVKFNKIDNPLSLLPIVNERLPVSCFMLNQLKFHEKANDIISIFTMNSGNDTWILTKYVREDWGVVISISAPDVLDIPKEIRQCLLSSGIIEWEKPFLLISLQSHITKLVTEICFQDLGLIITLYPCRLFHMEPSKALTLEPSSPLPSNVQLKCLDVESGTPFIADNWKYSKGQVTHTVVKKCIENFASGGIYLDGSLVTGAVTPAFGMIGMLHTDPDHRRKGYASNVMRFIFKQMAQEGLQPCLTSEFENKSAVNFHRSLGLQQVGQVTFIARENHSH